MSGMPPTALFHANIVYVRFCDEIGNFKEIQATGFWVKTDTQIYFVTNAHNLDPKMKLSAHTPFKLNRIEVDLRTKVGEIVFDTTQRYEFDIGKDILTIHPNADVACIKYTGFKSPLTNHGFSSFHIKHLADASFFNDHLNAMDVASFIGFPGKQGRPWYDEQWKLAIARTINIASFPRWEFTNRYIPTRDAMLVSGLSFSGSSGSPVLSHEKGAQLAEGLAGGSYTPPKLIGIMSGHWWNEEQPDDGFRHAGLSYLTRSTSILELVGS